MFRFNHKIRSSEGSFDFLAICGYLSWSMHQKWSFHRCTFCYVPLTLSCPRSSVCVCVCVCFQVVSESPIIFLFIFLESDLGWTNGFIRWSRLSTPKRSATERGRSGAEQGGEGWRWVGNCLELLIGMERKGLERNGAKGGCTMVQNVRWMTHSAFLPIPPILDHLKVLELCL